MLYTTNFFDETDELPAVFAVFNKHRISTDQPLVLCAGLVRLSRHIRSYLARRIARRTAQSDVIGALCPDLQFYIVSDTGDEIPVAQLRWRGATGSVFEIEATGNGWYLTRPGLPTELLTLDRAVRLFASAIRRDFLYSSQPGEAPG